MEQWLKLAKESAVFEAEYFVKYMRKAAQMNDVDPEWFIDEVIKNMHRLKNEEANDVD